MYSAFMAKKPTGIVQTMKDKMAKVKSLLAEVEPAPEFLRKMDGTELAELKKLQEEYDKLASDAKKKNNWYDSVRAKLRTMRKASEALDSGEDIVPSMEKPSPRLLAAAANLVLNHGNPNDLSWLHVLMSQHDQKLKKQIEELETSGKQQLDKIEELETSRKQQSDKIEALKTSKNKLVLRMKELITFEKQQLIIFQGKIEELHTSGKELVLEMKMIGELTTSEQQLVSSIKKNNEELTTSRKELVSFMEEENKELRTLTKQLVKSYEKDVKASKADERVIGELQTSQQQLVSDLGARTEELTTSRKELVSSMKEKSEELATSMKQQLDLERENGELQTSEQQLVLSLAVFGRSHRKMDDKIGEMEKERAETERECATLESRVEELECGSGELERERGELERECARLEADVESGVGRAANQKDLIKDLRERLGEISQEHRTARKTVEERDEDIARLAKFYHDEDVQLEKAQMEQLEELKTSTSKQLVTYLMARDQAQLSLINWIPISEHPVDIQALQMFLQLWLDAPTSIMSLVSTTFGPSAYVMENQILISDGCTFIIFNPSSLLLAIVDKHRLLYDPVKSGQAVCTIEDMRGDDPLMRIFPLVEGGQNAMSFDIWLRKNVFLAIKPSDAYLEAAQRMLMNE